MTGPQRRALEAIQVGPKTARQVAQVLWPDSPAWQKRTRKRLGRNGALGGTMPMKAGTLLRRLERMGLANEDSGWWLASWQGLGLLDQARQRPEGMVP